MSGNIEIIAAELGYGAQQLGTYLAGSKLEKYYSSFWSDTISLEHIHGLNKLPYVEALPKVASICNRLAASVYLKLSNNVKPLVIGGDHSIAIGTWSGIATSYMERKQDIGVIWIDAHLDAHIPETSPSGAIHGMPVASLLGFGPEELTTILSSQSKLKPENIVYIGARSYESEELDLLLEQGVKIFFCDQIKSLSEVIVEAKRYFQDRAVRFGVSLDLDVFDPKFSPGTGCYAPNGFTQEHVAPIVSLLQDPELIGFELVEYNPLLDHDEQTLRLCKIFINAFLHHLK